MRCATNWVWGEPILQLQRPCYAHPEQNGHTPMIVQVEPITIGNEHYVAVVIDGSEMEPRGPYVNADAAENVAGRLRRVARALTRGGSNDG